MRFIQEVRTERQLAATAKTTTALSSAVEYLGLFLSIISIMFLEIRPINSITVNIPKSTDVIK